MADLTQTVVTDPDEPRARRRSVIPVVAGVILFTVSGLLFGMKIGTWLKSRRPPGATGLALDTPELLGLAVVCIVALHGILLAHELGHLIAGRLVGFRAFLLIVGPLRLERGERGWSLHRNRSAALWGGLAGSVPTHTHNLRQRSAVMIAGGPITSLLVGCVGLGAWWSLGYAALGSTTPYGDVLTSFVLITGGGASLAIGLATLIPLRTSGFLSDGARLLRLARGDEGTQRDLALQQLIAQALAGVRPRDWDATAIAEATSVQDASPFEFTARQLAQLHALDAGREEEARTLLVQLLETVEQLPRALQPGFRLEAARQLALQGDVPAAEAQMAAAHGPAVGAPYARTLAQATILARRGEHGALSTMLPEVRRQLASNIDRGGAKLLLDAVDDLERGAVIAPSMQ